MPDETDLDDLAAVKRANPAPWITIADLRRQRAAVPETAFAQFHACRWGIGEGSWLPPGAWQACVGEPSSSTARTSGSASTSAANVRQPPSCGSNARLHVGAAIYHGDSGVLEAVDHVRALAGRYNVRELVYDPWRFGQAAQELEREGLLVVAFPQHDARMIPASARACTPRSSSGASPSPPTRS